MRYPIHPAAEMFPRLAGAEFDEFCDSIERDGLRESIKTAMDDGKTYVIDGRNRLAACDRIGIEPYYEMVALDGLSPVEYVLVHNLHRRHLTPSQKNAVAAEAAAAMKAEGEARKRANLRRGPESPSLDDRGPGGDSLAKAAERVGASRSGAAAAARIKREAEPEVFEAIKEGRVTTHEAETIAALPPETQKAVVALPTKAERKEAIAAAKPAPLADLPAVVPAAPAQGSPEMLVLGRRVEETVVFTLPDGRRIRVLVAAFDEDRFGPQVRLAIDAPRDIVVNRGERQDAIDRKTP